MLPVLHGQLNGKGERVRTIQIKLLIAYCVLFLLYGALLQ